MTSIHPLISVVRKDGAEALIREDQLTEYQALGFDIPGVSTDPLPPADEPAPKGKGKKHPNHDPSEIA